MYNNSIFSAILGLSAHWCITDVNLARGENRLEISVGTSDGALFSCPICRGKADVVSEEEARWQHENILNLQAHIRATLPLTFCSRCGINRVAAPWEKPESQFKPLTGQTDTAGAETAKKMI
jgi:transposase